MKDYCVQPQKESRVLSSSPKTVNQLSIAEVLQRMQNPSQSVSPLIQLSSKAEKTARRMASKHHRGDANKGRSKADRRRRTDLKSHASEVEAYSSKHKANRLAREEREREQKRKKKN